MRSPPHPITGMVSKGAILSAIASWTAATAARTGICRKTNVPLPWDGADDASPDVVLRLGKVPPRLETPDHIAPIFQTRGRGEYLLTLPGPTLALSRKISLTASHNGELQRRPDCDGAHPL